MRVPLADSIAPRTQDADGLVARPEGSPRTGVAIVQCEFRVVEIALDPRPEIVSIGHALSMHRGCPMVFSGPGLARCTLS